MNPYQPNANPMAQYANQIAGASVNGQGKWFQPGHYDVRVRQALCKRGEDPQNPGDFFIVEFEVLASSDPNNHPIGSTASFSRNLIKSTSHGDVKALFLGLAGLPPQDRSIDPFVSKLLMRAVESDNPLAGLVVHLEAFTKLSKRTRDPQNPTQGKPFTIHNWSGGTSGAQLAQIAASGSVGYAAPPPMQGFAPQQPAYGAPQAPGPYPNPFAPQQVQQPAYGAPPMQGFAPQAPVAPMTGFAPPAPGTRLAPGIVMGPNGQPIAG